MKDGLIFENNELVYYKNKELYHAGVIKVDGAIYYINSRGRAVRGQHNVHRSMSNGILKRGTYTFGDDYKLIEGSYIAPEKSKKKGHSKKSGKSRKASWKRFYKKNKVQIIIFEFALIFVVILGLFMEQNKSKVTVKQEVTEITNEVITLPEFEEEVLLCSKAAKMEYDGQELLEDVVKSGDPYRAFQFEYEFSDTLEDAKKTGKLFLCEDQEWKQAREYELLDEARRVNIDNLKTGTTYYYKVIVAEQEFTGSFTTTESTRFVMMPNLINTRDIGGYTNQDGKKVKQGLLIRGVELDGLENASYYISDEELDTVQETFGFAYDFDLRSAGLYPGEYSSRLGVPHKFYDSPMYGGVFNEMYRDSLRQIFADLADEEKYPMYLHCTWGTDRTGTIVFLLQGLLNLSEEDMVREYELTGYVSPSIVGNGNLNVIINGLQSYEGDTLQEKIYTYLTEEIGVSKREIESIREIFLE